MKIGLFGLACTLQILLHRPSPCDAFHSIIEHETEVYTISNPHIPKDGTGSGCTEGSDPACLTASMSAILSPSNIILHPLPTQIDTLESIAMKKVMNVPVPVYHFKQSARLSDAVLPFKLLLVRTLGPHPPGDIAVLDVDPSVATDSWFPGYYWSVLLCRECEGVVRHLGWKFSPVADHSGESFYAVIVDYVEDEKERRVSGYEEIITQEIRIGMPAANWMIGMIGSQFGMIM